MPYPSERVAGERICPSRRLAYAGAIRRCLTENPARTVEELMRCTGAPRAIVVTVKQRWLRLRAQHP